MSVWSVKAKCNLKMYIDKTYQSEHNLRISTRMPFCSLKNCISPVCNLPVYYWHLLVTSAYCLWKSVWPQSTEILMGIFMSHYQRLELDKLTGICTYIFDNTVHFDRWLTKDSGGSKTTFCHKTAVCRQDRTKTVMVLGWWPSVFLYF